MIQWYLVGSDSNYQIYRIARDNIFLSWKDIFEELVKPGDKFVSSFITLMESIELKTYYLEFVPVSRENFDKIAFEFVVIKTNEFDKKADLKQFGPDKLDTNSNEIRVFPNISNTALLICPCYNHQNKMDEYIHIGKFISSTQIHREQKIMLFKTAFNVYLDQLLKLPDRKLWLSTHGRGVAWLHIRIDLIPKYISWNKYK